MNSQQQSTSSKDISNNDHKAQAKPSEETSSWVRRSTRPRKEVSYPTQPLRNTPKRRMNTQAKAKGYKVSAEDVQRGRRVIEDLVGLDDIGLSDDEEKEQEQEKH